MKRKQLLMIVLSLFTVINGKGEQIYINPRTGNNSNAGTKEQPLKTIDEAARRANLNKENDATEIILIEGTYLLTETVHFNNKKYTSANRLIIRAEIMPDDDDWTPQRMPIVVTVVPLSPGPGGEEAKGLWLEVNHVTIEGLRFTGSPDYTYINGGGIRRSYPIERDDKSLEDLLVTQCLFAGNSDVMPLHTGVIANGNGLVIDHCVFFSCKSSVVFWWAKGTINNHNAIRYCLIYGNSFSGIWTSKDTPAEDLDFHHNIIANCKTAWLRDKGSDYHYNIHDCIFSGNNKLTAFEPSASADTFLPDFLSMQNVATSGNIRIEMDQSKRNYLQLAENSFGSDLGAGLFKKRK